jgi:hypothetical protein
MMKTNLETLTVEAFQPRVGNTFRIRASPEQTIDAELIEARALVDPGRSPKGASSPRTPFALLFRTTLKGALPQAIYAVEHDEMGACDIFLVPVGPDAVGMVYEAIFT